jgi:hypothetical protein
MFDTTSVHHLPRLHKLLRLLKKRVYNLGYNRHRAKRGSRKDLNWSKQKKKKKKTGQNMPAASYVIGPS